VPSFGPERPTPLTKGNKEGQSRTSQWGEVPLIEFILTEAKMCEPRPEGLTEPQKGDQPRAYIRVSEIEGDPKNDPSGRLGPGRACSRSQGTGEPNWTKRSRGASGPLGQKNGRPAPSHAHMDRDSGGRIEYLYLRGRSHHWD
jgi:hypothetical protein